MFFVSLKNELIISSKVDLLIFSETFIKLKLPQSDISSRNDTRSEVLFKRTLNVTVIFKISRVISCASERTRLLRIKTQELLKDTQGFVLSRPLRPRDSPALLTSHRPRFSSSPFRPQPPLWRTRSFSGFVAAFHRRLRKFRFFFLGHGKPL